MIIRPIEPREMDDVASLLVAANAEHLAAFPADVAEAYGSELRDVRRHLETMKVFVATAGDELVGTVSLICDSAHDSHPWPPGGAVLRLLAVHPSHRRGRRGEHLVVHCVEEAQRLGRRFLALHTAPVMASAKRLYDRLGFERTPEYDFRPRAHYTSSDDPTEPAWGEAYMVRFG